jgi:plastocyanin
VTKGWKEWSGQLAVAAALATALACGGSDGGGSPNSPSGPTVSSTGSVGAIGATITISSSGVNPSQVTVSVGQSVRFVSSDSRSHDMASDPHPAHTACPSLNRGIVSAGATVDSHGFGNAGTCTYHDHNDDTNNSLKGRITIQ